MQWPHSVHRAPTFWTLVVGFTAYYRAVSGLLSMPSKIAKEVASIAAAVIWTVGGNYLAVSLDCVAGAAGFSGRVRIGDSTSFRGKARRPPSQIRVSLPQRRYKLPGRADLYQIQASYPPMTCL